MCVWPASKRPPSLPAGGTSPHPPPPLAHTHIERLALATGDPWRFELLACAQSRWNNIYINHKIHFS